MAPPHADIGYIRVSSYSQNTDRQRQGVDLDKTFTEKASAKDTNRPQLQAAQDYLRQGDVLHVHSIDRLARSLSDLEKIIEDLISKGITVRFHKEQLTFNGDDSPMSRLLLQVIGAIGQFERELIKERQREGIAATKAAGKRVGGQLKLTDDDVKEVHRRLKDGATKKGLAKELGISRETLFSARP